MSHGFEDDKSKSGNIEQMIQTAKDNAVIASISAAQSIAYGAEQRANTHTNNQVNGLDSKIQNTYRQEWQNYANNKRNDAVNTANAYTNTQKNAAVNEAKAYTNTVTAGKQNNLAGGTLAAGTNLNVIIDNGCYWLSNYEYVEIPYTQLGYGMLEVICPSPSDHYQIMQRVTRFDGSNNFRPVAMYVRVWIGGGYNHWSDWVSVFSA